jgi:vanillate O-demethylase monooxygenase subunit
VPSQARLKAPAAIHESHGMVFISIAEPITEPPTIAAASDPTYDLGDLPVLEVRAGAALLADNFLDVAHFPFVHAGTFGADEAREVPQYRLERSAFGFNAVYEHEFANREDPLVATGQHELVQRRRLTYRYSAPLHLELAIEFLDAGGTNVIGFFLAPHDEHTVRIYSSLWRNDLGGSVERMRDAVEFEMDVIAEDLRIQSRYEQLSIPLDVTSEVHTRADKTTLEMRRVLIDFIAAADARDAGPVNQLNLRGN